MRPRLLLAFVVAGLVAGGAVLWLTRPAERSAPQPQRGGELVASLRSEPRSFNRLVARDPVADLLSYLTQGRLVRVNRVSFELEPWLAERWESAPDGLTHTLHLRRDVTWSDGTPFTSADVLFTIDALFRPGSGAILGSSLTVGGKPIAATAPDSHTVVVAYAEPFGPGLRILDNLWILPKHKLQAALDAGAFATAWNSATPPAEVVGTGPFTLAEYQSGQRVVLARNPRYWRRDGRGTPLPYLDRIVLEIVPDQNAEVLRLTSGQVDLTSSELRPDDYGPVKRAADQGRVRLRELGVGPDADALWFCLKPEAWKGDARFAFVSRPEFRKAISHAVDREKFAEHVFLGAAVPVWGPITPGNKPWFWASVPRYPPDLARARELLRGLGLEDRNGNGVVEDARGNEARFTMLTMRGNTALERGAAELRDQVAQAGIALDVAPLELGAMIQQMLASKYEAIFYRPLATDLDPALNKDLWLSSGSAHFWNLSQPEPATEWERRIDTLMREQASALDQARRREIFNEVQRVFAEHLPVLYFAAPRLFYAESARVAGTTPSVIRPPVLWNPDAISVRPN